MHGDPGNDISQQHEGSRSGSSLDVPLYTRQFTAKSAGVPKRGADPG